jgi:FdhE protein
MCRASSCPIPVAVRRRAARLRSLAAHSAIGGYLQLLAALADAQQALLDEVTPQQREALQAQARAQQSSAAAGAGMPLRPANTLQLDGRWRDWLRTLCRHCADEAGLPAETRQELLRVAAADDAGWMHRPTRCWNAMTRRRWMQSLRCW